MVLFEKIIQMHGKRKFLNWPTYAILYQGQQILTDFMAELKQDLNCRGYVYFELVCTFALNQTLTMP